MERDGAFFRGEVEAAIVRLNKHIAEFDPDLIKNTHGDAITEEGLFEK